MKLFFVSALCALACSVFPVNEVRADDNVDCRLVRVDCHGNPNHKCCGGIDQGGGGGDELDCRVALVDCEANPDSKCCAGANQTKGNPACVKKDGSFAVIGESYKVDCNTCKCSTNGPSNCTKMACSHRSLEESDEPEIKVCRKDDGAIAKVGESYKYRGGKCKCTDSGPKCKAAAARGGR